MDKSFLDQIELQMRIQSSDVAIVGNNFVGSKEHEAVKSLVKGPTAANVVQHLTNVVEATKLHHACGVLAFTRDESDFEQLDFISLWR